MPISLPNARALVALVLVASAAFLIGGCSSAYYAMAEMAGKHKRDLLISRVMEARDDQQQAKEAFKDALTRFGEVIKVDNTELKQKYEQLNDDLENCKERAGAVSKRIDSVEDVAEALFAEWEKELDQYHSPELRRASEDKLKSTRKRYEQLLAAMKNAEKKMQPVLDAFSDQVLFLKHNLNAQAIASIEGAAKTLQTDVSNLVKEMEKSIGEADAFIAAMGESK